MMPSSHGARQKFDFFSQKLLYHNSTKKYETMLLSICRPEYYHQTSDNVRQKIEFCPKKAASQLTQLSGVKFKKIISSRRLITEKHLVSLVSTFYFLCLYKSVNFDLFIKKTFFIFLCYGLFDPLFVY